MSETPAEHQEHYFSAQPAGDFTTSTKTAYLAGREVEVETAGGIFSPDHVDGGTVALLRTAPAPPETGNLLDIGCGWGPIALSMALESPHATVYAIDVNERAIELTRRNAERLGASGIIACTPEAVPEDVQFDAIWSNPPIRVGKAELHAIMRTWMPRLVAGGEAWLVVAKDLGGDSFQRWLNEEFGATHTTERIDTIKGFRVLRAVRHA